MYVVTRDVEVLQNDTSSNLERVSILSLKLYKEWHILVVIIIH